MKQYRNAMDKIKISDDFIEKTSEKMKEQRKRTNKNKYTKYIYATAGIAVAIGVFSVGGIYIFESFNTFDLFTNSQMNESFIDIEENSHDTVQSDMAIPQNKENTVEEIKDQKQQNSLSDVSIKDIQNQNDFIKQVMINGKIYYDTFKITDNLKCGNTDGKITYSVSNNEIPTINDQSNFGDGFIYQIKNDEVVLIYFDNEWHIFIIK